MNYMLNSSVTYSKKSGYSFPLAVVITRMRSPLKVLVESLSRHRPFMQSSPYWLENTDVILTSLVVKEPLESLYSIVTLRAPLQSSVFGRSYTVTGSSGSDVWGTKSIPLSGENLEMISASVGGCGSFLWREGLGLVLKTWLACCVCLVSISRFIPHSSMMYEPCRSCITEYITLTTKTNAINKMIHCIELPLCEESETFDSIGLFTSEIEAICLSIMTLSIEISDISEGGVCQ